MSLTIQDISKIENAPLAAEALAEDTVTKRLKLKDANLLSKTKNKFLGTEAWDVLLSYSAMDKLYSIDAKSIPVKERIIFTKIGEKFYIIRFETTREEFDKFNSAFIHIVKTVKFKD